MTSTITSYPGNLTPPRIPMDPVDLDRLPPDDVDACDVCGGAGAVWPVSGDPQDLEPCHACHGDGTIAAWSA